MVPRLRFGLGYSTLPLALRRVRLRKWNNGIKTRSAQRGNQLVNG